MLLIAAAVVVPVLAAPFCIYGLRYLFALFLREGVELFLDTELTARESTLLGTQLAKANVVLVVLLWLAIFATRSFELPMVVTALVSVLGVLIAVWISIEIVRHGLHARGWTATQIGLVAFAGGNLPFIVLAITVMVMMR